MKEDIVIYKDGRGGIAILTPWSEKSRRGLPVLRVEMGAVHGDFGPNDLVGEFPALVTAASIVMGWATKGRHKKEELEAARLFLLQWPEGPQLK